MSKNITISIARNSALNDADDNTCAAMQSALFQAFNSKGVGGPAYSFRGDLKMGLVLQPGMKVPQAQARLRQFTKMPGMQELAYDYEDEDSGAFTLLFSNELD